MSSPASAVPTSIDPAMAVVTVASGGERAGCLVGFHSQTSIEPARYAVWLSKANHSCRVALGAEHFAVHFLTYSDHRAASHFGGETGDDGDKFAGWAVELEHGAPVLKELPQRLVVRRTALLDEGGDHVCLVGEIVASSGDGIFVPLRMSAAEDIRPGHEAGERNHPPTERAAVH